MTWGTVWDGLSCIKTSVGKQKQVVVFCTNIDRVVLIPGRPVSITQPTATLPPPLHFPLTHVSWVYKKSFSRQCQRRMDAYLATKPAFTMLFVRPPIAFYCQSCQDSMYCVTAGFGNFACVHMCLYGVMQKFLDLQCLQRRMLGC